VTRTVSPRASVGCEARPGDIRAKRLAGVEGARNAGESFRLRQDYGSAVIESYSGQSRRPRIVLLAVYGPLRRLSGALRYGSGPPGDRTRARYTARPSPSAQVRGGGG
jgi:hypothetical protein